MRTQCGSCFLKVEQVYYADAQVEERLKTVLGLWNRRVGEQDMNNTENIKGLDDTDEITVESEPAAEPCPECANIEDEQYICTFCWCQGGNGTLLTYKV